MSVIRNILNSTKALVNNALPTTGSNTFVGTQTYSGSIIPATNNTYDLGDVSRQFRHLYLSSGSLYIDGQKVLGSTGNELQITTDTGQSIKILEAGSDNIILQSADGNIELKTSGGGDVILDPTSGVIGVKGTMTIYSGNKLLSSDGNAIQFGNDLGITGSLITTTGNINGINLTTFSSSIASTFLNQNSATSSYETKGRGIVSGSSQITYANISSIPSGIVSSSAQILNASGLVSGSSQITYADISSIPSGIVSGSSQITISSTTGFTTYSTSVDSRITTEKGRVDAILLAADADKDTFTEIVTLINSVDTSNDSTFASFYTASVGRLNNLETTSGSVNTSVSNLNTFSGSTLTRLSALEVETSNLESFTSSINTTIKTRLNVETVVSGSSQVIGILSSLNTYTGSNDTTNTAQNTRLTTIESVTGSYETKGRSIVSGSSQIDVMSTTNIVRLATTGSNTFNGNQSITGSISTTTYVGVTKAGANGVGEGPYVVVAQPASSIQYLMQLNASSGLDYWHYNGTAWSTPLKISSSGIITTGVIKGDSGADYPHSFTNTDAANTHWTNRSGRLLTSNGTNWVGDGKDPIMALVSGNNSTVRGNAIALAIHHEGQSDGTYSPMIAFSNKSNSGNYNTTYAAIMGKKTGQANDPNWSQGELHFFAQPAGTYMGDTPNFLLSSTAATFSGTITESSSLRYKENVETIKYGLDKVLQMRGVTYDKKDNGVKELGVIAEEVFEILPEVVLKNEEGEIDSVSYGRIVGVLIEAIKEQQKQIEELKSLIK